MQPHSLALMYAHGNSAVPKDLGKAIQWYELAAKKGVALAQHNLAACYANTDGPDRNLRLAAFWFHKAAEQGLRLSMESLRAYMLSARVLSGIPIGRNIGRPEQRQRRIRTIQLRSYISRSYLVRNAQRYFPPRGCTTSNNMATVIAGLKSFGVSDNFVRGTLFLFAATQMRTSDTITARGQRNGATVALWSTISTRVAGGVLGENA